MAGKPVNTARGRARLIEAHHLLGEARSASLSLGTACGLLAQVAAIASAELLEEKLSRPRGGCMGRSTKCVRAPIKLSSPLVP